jgi:molybdopterin converting factor small subunit
VRVIRVKVKLLLTLSVRDNEGTQELELEQGSSVSLLLDRLGVTAEMIGLIVINGKQQKMTTVLQENDEVWLIPPVTGG